jgi:hypothetical protein
LNANETIGDNFPIIKTTAIPPTIKIVGFLAVFSVKRQYV